MQQPLIRGNADLWISSLPRCKTTTGFGFPPSLIFASQVPMSMIIMSLYRVCCKSVDFLATILFSRGNWYGYWYSNIDAGPLWENVFFLFFLTRFLLFPKELMVWKSLNTLTSTIREKKYKNSELLSWEKFANHFITNVYILQRFWKEVYII